MPRVNDFEFRDFFNRLKWQQPFGPGAPGALALFDAFVEQRPESLDTIVYIGGQWRFAQPSGGSGTSFYQFQQLSPAATWTINHNLGRMPSVSLQTLGGVEIWADVIHLNQNQTQISLSVAATGRAYLT